MTSTEKAKGESAGLSAMAAGLLVVVVGTAVFVPHEVLRPAALGVAAAGALAVLGAKAYLIRLDETARFLASGSVHDQGEVLSALLGAREMRFLGLHAGCRRAEAVSLLRRRQRTVRALGVWAGAAALCGGLTALVAFTT